MEPARLPPTRRAPAQRASLAAAALWAAGSSPLAGAAHPLLTEDTGTQGRGGFQLELTLDRSRDRPAGAEVREQVATAVLSYGVREDVDLQFSLPRAWQHTLDAGGRHAARGALDASLDIKWRFFERDALSFGLKPGLTLPTGDKDRGFGTGRITWGALLILSYEPGPWAFHAHAGYRRHDNALDQRTALRHLSGAVTYKAAERLKLVADLSADDSPDRHDGSSLRYRIFGLIYSPTPVLDFDAGLKLGQGRGATDRAAQFGATWRW